MKYLILLTALLFNVSHASIINFEGEASNFNGNQTHQNPSWQQLALGEGNNIIDPYGIKWSSDGGETWGRNNITAGDNVVFKMNMFKKRTGTHYADHAKLWLDLNQDGHMSENESIIYGEQLLSVNETGNYGQGTPNVQNYEFISDPIHIGHEHASSNMWLMGRVVCSESLISSIGGRWNDQFKIENKYAYNSMFTSTKSYYQGESENWSIGVAAQSIPVDATPKPVPIGGTILLFIGGLAIFIKRKRQ